MIHSGRDFDFIFMTERGIAVPRGTRPFSDFYDWPSNVSDDDLVPLRPVLCKIVQRTLAACDSFTATLLGHILVPVEMAPGLRLYSRGFHDEELAAIPETVEKSLWCQDT